MEKQYSEILQAVLKKDVNSIKIHPGSDRCKRLLENFFPKDLVDCEILESNIKNRCFPVRIAQWQNGELSSGRCTLMQETFVVDKSTPFPIIPIIHILVDADLLKSQDDLPRHVKVMDSSIWNYCLWGDVPTCDFKSDTAVLRIKRAIDNIWHNWDKGYYMTAQAVEYADFNARISQQSYILGKHHGMAVAPFIFHSEYHTWEEKIEPKDANEFCYSYQWRFLLLDDYADTPLNRYKKTDPETSSSAPLPSKLDIVLDRLQSVKGMKIMYKHKKPGTDAEEWSALGGASANNFHIAIECVTCIAELLDRIGKKRYDLILLDYLLGKKDNKREYSYELFETLKKDTDNKLKTGPDNCLHFMFISSFVHAIQERLEEQHISRNDKKWFIGRGACPLNTPEIFLFNLHRCMGKKIMAMTYINDFPNCLKKLFKKSETNNGGKFVENCRSEFVKLLNFIMSLDRLRRNDLSGKDGLDGDNSVLATSINKGIPEQDFWEHLQHLCYMISFEPESRWPEWWEEYLFIKARLQKFGSQNANSAEYLRCLESLKSFITEISKIK